MNPLPLSLDYETNLWSLNEFMRRAMDATVPATGIIMGDVGGTSHTCLLQTLYDSTTGNWIIVITPKT